MKRLNLNTILLALVARASDEGARGACAAAVVAA
jgi:hypothetical protein